MILRNVALIVILTGTTGWAQTVTSGAPSAQSAPSNTPMQSTQSVAPMVLHRRSGGRSTWPTNPAAGTKSSDTLRPRIEDMEGTLTKMNAVLKQMRAKAAKSATKDSLTVSNIDMWELMINHLNKQLQELQATQAARQDLESRRAAMYKQADANVEAQAQARARAAAAQAAAGAQTPADKTPATQAAPPPPTQPN